MIHNENPYLRASGDRDPARRFRGRLAAPVTIVTGGSGREKSGLTVSSLFVVEGETPLIHLLVGPTSDLWSTIGETGRFVIHVCRQEHRALADVFAGLRPNPGGVFAGSNVVGSEWGPVLVDLPDRAFCTLVRHEEVGYSGVVIGQVDEVEVSDLTDPLVHFRSGYRRLE